jgi:hypothetical protein
MLVIDFPTTPAPSPASQSAAAPAARARAIAWSLDDVAVLFRSLRNMRAVNQFILTSYNPKHPNAPLALIDLREIVRLIDLKNECQAQPREVA